MKNSFSSALFRENLRRFWTVPALGFFVYFFAGPMQLIAGHGWLSYYEVNNLIVRNNLGAIFASVGIPILATTVVFSYLFKTGSTSVTHSMPFSRKRLYVTNYLSAICLTLIPLLVTALIFLAFTGHVDPKELAALGEGKGIENPYTTKAVLGFFCRYAVISLYGVSLGALAAAVSGTTVIHMLTAGALGLVPMGISFALSAYANKFIYGYSSGDMFGVERQHPVLAIGGGGFYWSMLIWVAISAVVAVIGYLLYTKRKNERAGDSFVFKGMGWIVEFLLTLAGTSFVGLVFDYELGILAYAIGFVISILVSTMIVRKSFRIFDGEFVKTALIILVAIALIIGSFVFDVFGISKRVPDPGDLQLGTISIGSLGVGNAISVDGEELEKLTAFHRTLVTDEARRKDPSYNGSGLRRILGSGAVYTESSVPRNGAVYSSVNITYVYGNGKLMQRYYSVDVETLKASEELRSIYTSDKRLAAFDKLFNADLSTMSADLSLYMQPEDKESPFDRFIHNDYDDKGNKIAVYYNYHLDINICNRNTV
ncbi:MAG: hypothetical protein II689_03810, partial [Firmicutes bacterium]|nr:hypothetical protein [Bacillota bacterium]